MQPNEIIKKHIAPYGLHCGGCFAFNGGNIQKHSTELIKSLGNFDVYAQRFVTMRRTSLRKLPEFQNDAALFLESQMQRLP